MPKDNALLLSWLEAIEAEDHKLTPWEVDFVESVGSRIKKNLNLTDRQEEILERIYAEKTS